MRKLIFSAALVATLSASAAADWENVYLVTGTFPEGDFMKDAKVEAMTKESEDNFVIDCTLAEGEKFVFAKNLPATSQELVEYNYGISPLNPFSEEEILSGNAVDLAEGNGGIIQTVLGISLPAGSYRFRISLTEYNNVTFPELYVTTVSDPNPDPDPDPDPESVYPEHLYMLGTVNGSAWNTANGLELTKAESVYTAENVTIDKSSDTSDSGYFCFVTMLGANWDEVNAGDRYGAGTKDEPITSGTAATLVAYTGKDAGASQSFMAEAAIYTVSVDLEAMTVTITKTADLPNSGIATVNSTENTVAEWFTLQGIRCNAPVAGQLYIIRQGTKTAKVIAQ